MLIGEDIGKEGANLQMSKEGNGAVGGETLLDKLIDSGRSNEPMFISLELRRLN